MADEQYNMASKPIDDKADEIMADDVSDGRIFSDMSTDCAICLGSLTDPDMEVIELTTCGHRWHLECLKEQLAQARPNPAQRLVLTGCRCAKCGVVCEHPKLKDLTRQTDALRVKVDALLKEQVLADKDKNNAVALEHARQKCAIYLCSLCQEPYFGGTIACADTAEGEVPPEERLCVACKPQDNVPCRRPLEHRGHHYHKCRYCCRPSNYVCYGTVHFCDSCHDRNSQRVQAIRKQQWQQRQGIIQQNNLPPAALEPIPCPGGDACPYPKKHNQTQHANGSSADCEQVYGCAICQSSPSNNTEHAFVEPPGSRNLLQNGCGQHGLVGTISSIGWFHFNNSRPARWQVEQSDTPLRDGVSTNFVSSFQWCVMAQSVSLRQFVRNPAQATIEVSAKYMARTDCASVFRLEALLLDQNRRVLQRLHTNILNAPPDFWERASLTLVPTAGAHEVVIVIHGKDVPFWRGNFGSKVTDCQVRILGSPEELERQLIINQQEEERVNAPGEIISTVSSN
jgi:F-box associated region/RING-like zinc finger